MSTKTPTATQEAQIQELVRQYRFLFAADQVVELRALGVRYGNGRPHTEAGFFGPEDVVQLARTAQMKTPIAKGVYFTLNPLRPDILARRRGRLDWAGEGELAKDKDVLCRRWLLVDADPVRDPQISATDTEKAHSYDTILMVREHLWSQGWADPILADSGNGYHLLYRINTPAEDNCLVPRLLESLARQFNSDEVVIDTTVGNASRICKLPGTWARKGDNLPERPHRQASLLEIPDALGA